MLKPTVCLIAIVVAASVHAEPIPAGSDFRSLIPQGWRSAPAQGSTAQRFVSPRGDAWIVLSAKPAGQPVAAQLARLRTVRGVDITYEREGRTWIVVSGFKGNRIFYGKAILACGGSAWHYLKVEYPAVEKRAFDQFVTRSSTALGAYAKSGCYNSQRAEAAR